MRPDFLVIGAAKCGTSTLRTWLGRHPDVFVHPHETNFFADDVVFARGMEWYESLFADAGGAKAVGEGSNPYANRDEFPKTVARVAEALPGVRLLYIVRHPLRRLESAYVQKLQHGAPMPGDFPRAVLDGRLRIIDYGYELEAWRAAFPEERIRVVFTEDLKADRTAVLAACYEFLGVDPAFAAELDAKPVNVSEGKTVLSPALSSLRRRKTFGLLKKLAPAGMRAWARRTFLTRTWTGRPEWTDEAYEFVKRRLDPAIPDFLERHGKPRDFWDLSAPPPSGD